MDKVEELTSGMSARFSRSRLERAIVLAVNGHSRQVDKSGQPYILHPLRVMLQMDTETEMAAAVLHDILEDTIVPESAILSLVGYDVLELVKVLTHDGRTELYDDYITRVKQNPTATKIKIADILDNKKRLSGIQNQKLRFILLGRYERALERLQTP